MAKHYQDFVGLNTFIYESIGYDERLNIDGEPVEPNTAGSYAVYLIPFTKVTRLEFYENDDFLASLVTTTPNDPDFFNLLMSHRGNVYGYPTWRQVRVSHNPLTRKQRKENIFTHAPQPGPRVSNGISTYGATKIYREPVVTDSYRPVSLIGEVKVYNENLGEFQQRSVELKTSFGNETSFFANQELNDYFETIAETDDNYEQLKELYVDGGLEDDGSPIDAFNMFIYRQSIYPKQQFSYLNKTRSRTFFLNSFWRKERNNRTETYVTTGFGSSGGFGSTVPSQSMWPLDVSQDWATKAQPSDISDSPPGTDFVYNYYIGASLGTRANYLFGGGGGATGTTKGFNTGKDEEVNTIDTEGGSGILMNSYSQFTRGHYDSDGNPQFGLTSGYDGEDMWQYLHSSPFLSRRHAMNSIYSVVGPSGMEIYETGSQTSIPTGSLFEGLAAWDCARQAGKDPFYESYDAFATETRAKGKGFTTVPEFRISNHVEEYYSKGVTEELSSIFELSGALSLNTTTETEGSFYKVLSTTEFLKHFDLVKKDHKDLASEKILSLKCKAIKKFLPYDGFYPAEQTVEIAKEFKRAIEDDVVAIYNNSRLDENLIGIQGILEPLFAPGVLFNTIKSGVAVDYPIILPRDNPVFVDLNFEGVSWDTVTVAGVDNRHNYLLAGSDYSPHKLTGINSNLRPIWSKRIDFESLVEPEKFLSNLEMSIQEGHPFGLREDGGVSFRWGGKQKLSYKGKINNFLAEVADLFLSKSSFTTIASKEEQSPEFGNAIAGKFYTMRLKMSRSRNKGNLGYSSWGDSSVNPPQDIHAQGVRETFTMYSRPSAFGINVWGSKQSGPDGTNPIDSMWGSNYCFTPPYYHGEAWCDLIFYATETKKYTLDEILSGSSKHPYYTRHWQPGIQDALRDLTGYFSAASTTTGIYEDYSNSAWRQLFDEANPSATISESGDGNPYDPSSNPTWSTLKGSGASDFGWSSGGITYFNGTTGAKVELSTIPPQHPSVVNYNAMQLDSSVNVFGKGTIKTIKDASSNENIEVASSDTVRGKTRWIIQPKFETPMLNFNKYSILSTSNCTPPLFAAESVPRGMWHQYGTLPTSDEGVFLQVTDIPESWLEGALAISGSFTRSNVDSLADLVGFSKDPVRLGEIADVKQISEAVVAVPFIEKDGTRQFFSIPREDINSCIGAVKREVDEGTFVAGGSPKAGDSVYQMVKKMQKYVFPPSMDFVRYKEVDPFAMYVFEFKHNLTKQDLSDIWQNLPPDIGTHMQEAEATISHELLAHELLGGGAVVNNGVLDENAEGKGIPSNIQWMIFKAKKRAKTNYFDKVVAKKGTTKDTSSEQLENAQGQTGDDLGITYNWPYDFFSLVELVKIDAEVTFANIGNDDKGQKTIKKVEKKSSVEMKKAQDAIKNINIARGKGKSKK